MSDRPDGSDEGLDAGGEPLARPPRLALVRGTGSSEDALARQFADEHAGGARYVAAWGKWLRLTGHIWVKDDTLATLDAVRDVTRRASGAVENPSRANELASAKTMRAVEAMARTDRKLAATIDQWDADDFLINTPGETHLLRDWASRLQRPEDYLTRSTAIAPAPEGATPALWMTFLNRITGGDGELILYLQRMCGLFLTGDTSTHALFFAYGTGANGKSVFSNTVLRILGSYAITSPVETFMASDDNRHPTELADLVGARLVCATETEQGRRWAESRLKQLTGGDPVKARYMRQDFFEFRPKFKLLICGNHKPALRGVDEAIRRRLHLIPFRVTVPKSERDPALAEKLTAEWPAILRWMIDGYRMFADEGLNPPPAVADATSEYFEAEDSTSLWLADCCKTDPNEFTSTAELFASWQGWAKAAGEFVGDVKRFSRQLESHGFRWARRMTARGFWGLGLKVLATSPPPPAAPQPASPSIRQGWLGPRGA